STGRIGSVPFVLPAARRLVPIFVNPPYKGKPYKVAVTACMRKLPTISNARMRDYFAANDTAENGIRTA
ncbi:hypothetical protein ACGLWF_000847, partial [Neisseria gonorrhoeae]